MSEADDGPEAITPWRGAEARDLHQPPPVLATGSPGGGPPTDVPASGSPGDRGLSHLDPTGAARMVDVSRKGNTERVATATGVIRMDAGTLALIQQGALGKGDVLAVARVAGYMAAKRTAELIPLCHPLPLEGVELLLEPDPGLPGIRVTATVRYTGKTGVEMEALTAVSVCLLTIYDMAKAVDRAMEIGYISVLSKIGGKSGPWQRT